MGQTLTDDQVVVLESLDFDVVCQIKEACGNPARWQLVCVECGDGSPLFCGPCRVLFDMGVAAQLAVFMRYGLPIFTCGKCHGVASRFPDLFVWRSFEAKS